MGLYGRVYGNFASKIYAEIRREAFGEDIGQFSWLTSADQDRFLSWLTLSSGSRVLDVCCGAGGPTLRLAKLYRCTVIGIDAEEKGIASATAMAESQGLLGWQSSKSEMRLVNFLSRRTLSISWSVSMPSITSQFEKACSPSGLAW
jgi:SAM-dependent methyltransferase